MGGFPKALEHVNQGGHDSHFGTEAFGRFGHRAIGYPIPL
jgi:hypothetical protein